METFKKLSGIDISDKVDQKKNLTYLSWAHAWGIANTECESVSRTIYEDPVSGLPYFTDGKTCYVKVGVTVDGHENIDYLPVMDFRNDAIPLEKVTMVDVNKSIQRSTAKAIAMHGLGLKLWTKEDIMNPQTPIQKEQPAPETKPEGKTKLVYNSANWKKVAKYVATNKALGIDMLVSQLSTKYEITDEIQSKLNDLI